MAAVSESHGIKANDSKTDEQDDIDAPQSATEVLDALLNSLPLVGKITFEKENSYWSLNLPERWTQKESEILKCCEAVLGEHDKTHDQAIALGNSWADLLKVQDPHFEMVTPPSESGYHITLGRWSMDDDDKPHSLIPDKTVGFKLTEPIVELTLRPLPVNLPGQHTDNEGMRFYPVLWILQRIELIDFELDFEFSPHISLAVLACKFKVDAVEKLNESKGGQ